LSFTSLSQQAGRYAAIAMGASIPISVALDNVLSVFILLAWLASARLGEKLAGVRANPAAIATLAFLGLLVAGLAWGPGSLADGLHYLSKYRDLLLVALLGAFLVSERDKSRALDAFLAAMALTLAASYAIRLGLLPIDNPPARYPGNPTVFKTHITHSLLMALAAFLAADRAMRAAQRGWRIAYAAGAALAACNVFMVHGRSGYLVFAVLALYLAVAHWRWRGVGAALVAGSLMVVISYLAYAPLFDRGVDAVVELRDWHAGRANETSTGFRMNYYKTTVAIVRDHPLLGVGTGGFVPAYREKIAGSGLPESTNPHNQYLLTAAQLGVVGLFALIALFVVMWRQAGALEPPTRAAARGLVLAIAVGSLLNSLLIDHTEGLLFAWMAGVLFASPRPAR
jgi:O-antigen ligase